MNGAPCNSFCFMFRDLDLYKKISISKKFEGVNFENFEWPAAKCLLTYRVLIGIFRILCEPKKVAKRDF